MPYKVYQNEKQNHSRMASKSASYVPTPLYWYTLYNTKTILFHTYIKIPNECQKHCIVIQPGFYEVSNKTFCSDADSNPCKNT